MGDTERVIGMLLEFKRSHEKHMDEFTKETRAEFGKVNKKLDSLTRFKWKVAGGASVVSGLVIFGFKLADFLSKHG